MILTLTLGLVLQQIRVPESMDLSRFDRPVAQQLGHFGGARAAIACDDFNRANGPLGADWTDVSGSQIISSNQVTNNSGGANAWMRHNSASSPYGSAVLELDLVANPTGASRYSALIVGEDGFGEMLYIKVQNQTGLAGYSNYAFYHGFNGGGIGGWGGFFSFGLQIDAANDGAHMRVSHSGDVTYLEIDDDNNGVYEYSFNSIGTVGASGLVLGTNCGYGAWGDGTADNWELNGGCSGPSFTLTRSGVCPGLMTLSTAGGTANSSVAILYGNAGSFTKPSGACAGITLGISNPNLGAFLNSNGSGAASVSFNASAAFCGRTVQAVDVASCTASNTVVL